MSDSMSDPTFTAAATATVEAAINKALAHDPGTRLALQQLAGQSLAVDLTRPQLSLCFHFDSEQVRVSHNSDNDNPHATTRLRGSPLALARLAMSDSVSLADSGVSAFGSTALLTRLQGITRQLDIDWEDMISQWLGDILGHQTAAMIRKGATWATERGRNSRRLLEEFLTEELRGAPTAAELRRFSDSVDTLQLDVDRAEARLNLLRQTLHTPSAAPASPQKD